MPDNSGYDDLFASYEKRNRIEKEHTEAEAKKSASGYTSASSYKKPRPSSGEANSSFNERFERAKRNRSPEKSTKTYYGGSSGAKTYSSGPKRNAIDDRPKSKVKFNHGSEQARKKTAVKRNDEFVKKYGLSDNGISKDEYRKRFVSEKEEAKQKSDEKKEKAQQRKESALNTLIKKRRLITLIIGVVLATVFTLLTISCVNDVLAIHRHSEKAVTVTIDRQVTTDEVLDILKENDLIENKWFCKLLLKAEGFTDNYETGVFYLSKEMGIEGMIYTLKASSQTEETVTITFPEGYSIMQIAAKLEANDVCTTKNFLDTLENYKFEYDFIPGSLKTDKRKYQYLEGYLFPSTYEFYVGESPSSVISKMLDAFKTQIYSDELLSKSEELGFSINEVVTLASIIQREAANTEQMNQIASVLNNRLKNSSTFPRLECDSTTDFLNKDISEFLKVYPDKGTIDYYALYYSTYSNNFVGLPAGPICNPGKDAINAVLNVEYSDYYFFFHDTAGEMHLASTDYEFEYLKSVYGVADSESD